MFLKREWINFFYKFFDKKGILFFSFFFVITAIIVFFPSGNQFDFFIQSLFLLVSTISLFGIFSNFDKLGYSINKVFFIFHFLFFGLAPVIQFKKNITFFGGAKISLNVYIELALVLILIQLLYLFCYKYLKSYFLKKYNKKAKCFFTTDNQTYNYRTLVGVSFFSFIIFIYLIKYNWEVVFLKPSFQWQKNNTNLGLLGYALLLAIRKIPFIVFLLYKINKKSTSFIKEFTLFLFVLIVSFPTSLPRADVLIYYLPIVLLYLPKLKKPHLFSISFLVLFSVLFPLLNYFRNFDVSEIDFGMSLFETAHMDAFHNYAQIYSQQIITNGRQLIGSVLFFIQESQWVNRPVGTGQMLAELNCYSYSNISMPFWGEGYVNFGFLGIVLCVVILAILNALLDVFKSSTKTVLVKLLFLFFIGIEFYLLRGDLFSSFKKIFSLILGGILTLFFCKLINNFFLLTKKNKI